MIETPKDTPEPDVWKRYIETMKEGVPSPELISAMSMVNHKHFALDIGAGPLVSTRYLRQQGFEKVRVIDNSESSKEISESLRDPGIEFHKVKIEDFAYTPDQYDFVNAEYSLSFIDKDRFSSTFQKILASLHVGGLFSGNIFGERDDWNTPGTRETYLSELATRTLFEGMEIIRFEPYEGMRSQRNSGPKQWHEFYVAARKK